MALHKIKQDEQASVLIFVGLALVIIFGVLALVIDITRGQSASNNNQGAVDAAVGGVVNAAEKAPNASALTSEQYTNIARKVYDQNAFSDQSDSKNTTFKVEVHNDDPTGKKNYAYVEACMEVPNRIKADPPTLTVCSNSKLKITGVNKMGYILILYVLTSGGQGANDVRSALTSIEFSSQANCQAAADVFNHPDLLTITFPTSISGSETGETISHYGSLGSSAKCFSEN